MPESTAETGLHSSWNDLLVELLQNQRSMTVVERFAQIHDQQLGESQTRYFRDLIPLSKPTQGQQYSFEVDLDRCSSCKACVTACHSLNGLGTGEVWRNVGLLSSTTPNQPLQKTVTTACHHCLEPGCLQGCPVLAYDKDPVTGIVRHLDDQCIGCQYCILKCPYDVPKYSASLGIVRKCDLCSNRLAVGEAPACVQACPNEAIRVVLVDSQEIRSRFKAPSQETQGSRNAFLPDSPPPDYTFPTTRFLSRDPLVAELRAADSNQYKPADPHMPLVYMLTLSQAAAGLMLMAMVYAASTSSPQGGPWMTPAALVLLLASMALGATHLGQPLKAWKSFLGWRQSWLSRELLVFGTMLPAAVLAATSSFKSLSIPAPVHFLALSTAALFGLLGVGCSAMLYADTRRPFWKARRTFPLFYSSTIMLGLASASVWGAGHPWSAGFATALATITILKLASWLRFARHHGGEASDPDTKSAKLIWGPLFSFHGIQLLFLSAGGIVLPVLVQCGASHPETLSWFSWGLIMLGDGAEKCVFFRAVVPLKMPGGIAA